MPEHLERLAGGFEMSEKKVVVLIVEGPSEEAALGSILKEFFSNEEIQFLVVHGDITVQDYTSVENIISKLNELIDTLKQKYGYKETDFLKIIQIADTDGAFCKDIIIGADVEGVHYYTDHEKEELADNFADRYEGKLDEFIEFISHKDLAVPGSFKQT